jgi:mono/diheme cytochrome c family protein
MSDDGKLQLMHVGRKFAPGALAEFLLAPEAHFKWTRMPNFRLTRQEAEALAAHLLASADPWTGPSVPDPDATSLSRGKTLVQSAGCLSCHAAKLDNKFAPVELASRLGKGAPRSEKSCVDGAAPAARFAFNGPEKEALKAFLADANVGLASLGRHAPAEFASRQVKGLQCNGCHGQLEGFPAIDGLGGKLRPEWTSAFIAGQVPYKPRPEKHADGHDWLAARMPAFPARAALLAEGLAAANGVPPRTPAEPPIDRAAAKQGEILVSANGGFACVTCHAVGPAAATQVFESEGVNLAYSSERLLPSFFRRWLRNPMKVDPTTKMPVYFDEEGKSPVTTIYDGDGDKQIEALWHYLRSVGHGRGARPGATASR